VKIKTLLLVTVLIGALALEAVGQDSPNPKSAGGDRSSSQSAAEAYPEIELAAGFSFLCACPNISYFKSFYLYGGGGAAVYNIKSWIGIKGEFMGYTTSGGYKNQFTHLGAAGAGNGNLFTYTFGPQVKKQWGKFRPFGEFLIGGAHSNAYAKIFGIETGFNSSSENALAMQFGAGLDIPLTDRIQIRPAEFDCLYTKFSANGLPNYGGTQHSFKYVGGVNFTFGHKRF
jgi:opacity protein-like surface antigen